METNKGLRGAVFGMVFGVCMAATTPASAVFLNFEGFQASTNLGGTPNNPASVLSTQLASQGIVFGRTGVSTGVAVINNNSTEGRAAIPIPSPA